ncbi:MAG: HIT family protein [archaeon]
MEITQEQLQNLSPEELRDLQKQNCIFCHIISGKVQSKKIYEDEVSYAILDINPCNPGHILLLTKEHYSIMPQVPDDHMAHLGMVAKALSNAALKSLKCQGTNIYIANGIDAGQKAPHFMMHVVPRMNNDTIKNFKMPLNAIGNDMQDQAVKKIAERLSREMGTELSNPVNLDKPAGELEKPQDKGPEADAGPADKKEHDGLADMANLPDETPGAGSTKQSGNGDDSESQADEDNGNDRPDESEADEEDKEEDEEDKEGVDLDMIAGVLLGGQK